jgi:hypothetical protein
VDAEGAYDFETLEGDGAAHKVIVIRKHEVLETTSGE